MKLSLYVDDIRNPQTLSGELDSFTWFGGYWTLVRTARQAVALIDTGDVEYISLDHDMGLHQLPGMFILGYLYGWMLKNEEHQLPVIRIHTANIVQKPKMLEAVKRLERRFVDRMIMNCQLGR